jgi:hypothetical protein
VFITETEAADNAGNGRLVGVILHTRTPTITRAVSVDGDVTITGQWLQLAVCASTCSKFQRDTFKQDDASHKTIPRRKKKRKRVDLLLGIILNAERGDLSSSKSVKLSLVTGADSCEYAGIVRSQALTWTSVI